MKDGNFRNSWIEEFESLKNLVIKEFSEDGFRNLKENSAKIATYHYNKRKLMLLGEERKLYNFLIENSYNPFTVYRWLLLERIPEDIKFQLRNNYLNQKKAIKLSFQRKHKTKGSLCTEIKNLGMQLLQGW